MTIELPQIPFEITVEKIDIINVRDDFETKTCLINFKINDRHTYVFYNFEYTLTWENKDILTFVENELIKYQIKIGDK